MYKILLTLLFLAVSNFHVHSDDLYYPSFHEGMMRGGRSEKFYHFTTRNKKSKSAFQKEVERYINSYENAVAILRSGNTSREPTIPKIIHVIWLGSEIPEKYGEWQQTWKDMEGWEYRLWTDQEVASLTLANQDLYDRATNYGEKSDILRLEILYQFGGLYVDTDFACVNPAYFEAFHHCLDFYIGLEPLMQRKFILGNALIGASPRHPLMHKLIDSLHASDQRYTIRDKSNTVERTGPSYITRIIDEYITARADNPESVSVFPSSFFFPINASELRRIIKEGGTLSDDDLPKETCGIHYWDASWFVSAAQ